MLNHFFFCPKSEERAEKEKSEIQDDEKSVADEKGDSGDDASGSADDDTDSDTGSNEENPDLSGNEGEEADENGASDEEGEDKQSPLTKKPKRLSDVKEGKTLFIRNLSFDSTEESVQELFEQFGEVEYCKLLEDKRTGHSRGMAFVKFITEESADRCLAEASKESSGKIVTCSDIGVLLQPLEHKLQIKTAYSRKLQSNVYEGYCSPRSLKLAIRLQNAVNAEFY